MRARPVRGSVGRCGPGSSVERARCCRGRVGDRRGAVLQILHCAAGTLLARLSCTCRIPEPHLCGLEALSYSLLKLKRR